MFLGEIWAENTVKVDRRSRWGNSHVVGTDVTYYRGPGFECITHEQAVSLFRDHCEAMQAADLVDYRAWLAPLRGKHLACWCRLDQPCHADVLLEIANAPLKDGETG